MGLLISVFRVANVKNQPPDFEQPIHAHEELTDAKQSHTKTSPPSMQTAPKLLYVAKGLICDDVIRFSMVVLPKPCWDVGVSNVQICVTEVVVQRQWSFLKSGPESLCLIQTHVTFAFLARWQRTFNHYQTCFICYLDQASQN